MDCTQWKENKNPSWPFEINWIPVIINMEISFVGLGMNDFPSIYGSLSESKKELFLLETIIRFGCPFAYEEGRINSNLNL